MLQHIFVGIELTWYTDDYFIQYQSYVLSKLIIKSLTYCAFIHFSSKNLKLADNNSSSEVEVTEKNIAQVLINAAFNYQWYYSASLNSPNLI